MAEITGNKIDIAQRIAEALSRTSDPGAACPYEVLSPGWQVIGSVPMHLRHLYNLQTELVIEAADAEVDTLLADSHACIVHKLLFEALKQHVPQPRHTHQIDILVNWDVVCPDERYSDLAKRLSEVVAEESRDAGSDAEEE